VTDAIYSDRRLARLYDVFEGHRADLDVYAAMAEEFGARTVVDVGCGTGTFACLLAQRGIDVVAVDPADASLEVARAKPGADLVRWVHGEVDALPGLQVDLVTMTGNVAQVFLTDAEWESALRGVRTVLRPGGRMVFETRDPVGWWAWVNEARAEKLTRTDVPGVGVVETRVDLTPVSPGLVCFGWTFVFLAEGVTVTADSTVRFRGREELAHSLLAAGFVLEGVRGAPDRPGRELVFVASSPEFQDGV